MALVQRDFILRMIEAVAAAIAAALRKRQGGDLPGARADLAGAMRELLGSAGPLIQHTDARTAVDLLGDARRVVLWTQLLLEDSELLRAMGRPEEAARVINRARELAREVQRRKPELSDEDQAQIDRVAATAEAGQSSLQP